MSPALASSVTDADRVVATDLAYCGARLAGELASMSGARVLVTGGAGFLGYYLVQLLLWRNRDLPGSERIAVTIVDNYVRGVPSWLEALESPHVRLLAHDATRPLPEETGDFDFVVHAASIASPTFYREHPIETMDANVTGLRLLLDRARAQQDAGRPVKGFLFFSSSEIYGDPEADAIPTPETYPGRVSSTGPRACYDESKRYGETLCVNFARTYGLPIVMVRPFNNYGPGLRIGDRRVIPDFAKDVLAGRDFVLHSNGSPTRTFCYVADAVVGYYKALVRGRPGEPYNIGSQGPEVTVRELAGRMATIGRDLMGYGGAIVHRPSADPQYLTDNPQRRCPDLSKARQELDYAPGIDLDEGLRRTLRWYVGHQEEGKGR